MKIARDGEVILEIQRYLTLSFECQFVGGLTRVPGTQGQGLLWRF